MAAGYRMVVALAGLAVAGCGPQPIAEQIELEFVGEEHPLPALVDTVCSNGGCDSTGELEVQVTLAEHGMIPAEAFVEILQYRIDYEIPDIAEEVPFFAAEISELVNVGDTVTLTVLTAGMQQRNWLYERFVVSRTEGTATLTLAGFDYLDKLTQADAEFDIVFGDLVDEHAEESDDEVEMP